MSWIAKNSITGKEYGKKFDSIFDCQNFIDTDLKFLQYEWKQIKHMEESYQDEVDYLKWYKKHYGKENTNFCTEFYARIQYAVTCVCQNKSFESVYGQNVIRCYYVEQHRFAEGMDF